MLTATRLIRACSSATSLAAAVLLVLVALLSVASSRADAYTYKVPAQTEECFYELVTAGTTVSITFTVTHGGKLDINAAVRGRNLETGGVTELNQWSLATEGTYEWVVPASSMPHRFEVCFSNKMARWTPKWISFDFFKMLPTADDGISGDANKPFQKIEVDLHACAQRVFNMRNKMNKLKASEVNHRDTMESVVNWIGWGTVVHCMLLVLLAVFEFFYLKSFLAVRAVVRI